MRCNRISSFSTWSLLLSLLISFTKSSDASKAFLPSSSTSSIPRGGATSTLTPEAKEAIQNYRLSQQHLLQLRSTYLSEALSARGIHIGPTITDVSTPEGAKPPQPTDWDCAISTYDHPKSCLYSFDAEPNTKVLAPVGTTQYISLKALNRLRRMDPTKVEPMWHSQYAILDSWFKDTSEFSLLQFVNWKGFIVSTILLDLGKGMALKGLLMVSCLMGLLVAMPVLEVILSRFLTSSLLWMKWMSWGRFVHAALPLKILIGQMAWKFLAGSFGKLESAVRDYIVELECNILEESIPVTVRDDDDDDEVDAMDGDADLDLSEEDDMEESSEEYDDYDDYDDDY
ncbi:hypothetical protein CTEN210_01249 [Chaetoceros tenuissimus]|uniref:Chloride channel CLIC-like protein 1 n=1 Tax=Chaetoceros tenuissimus TaxID=426638 RepID=A0AAD3CHL3_9STRA|nr:hypothetical protein CTEN210_01249 [Chaetoceros tenuissimus]